MRSSLGCPAKMSGRLFLRKEGKTMPLHPVFILPSKEVESSILSKAAASICACNPTRLTTV